MNAVCFDSGQKDKWLKIVAEVIPNASQFISEDKSVNIKFDIIKAHQLTPFHFVSLACLLQLFKNCGCVCFKIDADDELRDFLDKCLRFNLYFSSDKNDSELMDIGDVFHLWKISDSQKDIYSYRLIKQLKSLYLEKYDLSYICESLQELYYNIFDHAKANGNAFSMVMYDENCQLLQIAVCDMGIGMAQSVRNFDKDIDNDAIAIAKAVERGFTVKSTERNRGFGLDNILSNSRKAEIISGAGCVCLEQNCSMQSFTMDYYFKGTMISVEYDLSASPLDDDSIDEFNL